MIPEDLNRRNLQKSRLCHTCGTVVKCGIRWKPIILTRKYGKSVVSSDRCGENFRRKFVPNTAKSMKQKRLVYLSTACELWVRVYYKSINFSWNMRRKWRSTRILQLIWRIWRLKAKEKSKTVSYCIISKV